VTKEQEALALLTEVAAQNPVQEDHNEEVIWWCSFCGAEATVDQVQHDPTCLWVRICEFARRTTPC
jgi:hypothetical protein